MPYDLRFRNDALRNHTLDEVIAKLKERLEHEHHLMETSPMSMSGLQGNICYAFREAIELIQQMKMLVQD